MQVPAEAMASEPLNIMKITRAIREACKIDDVSLMSHIVSTASQPNSTTTVQEVLDIGLKRSTSANATKVLSYVLKEGADVRGHGTDLTLSWGTFSLPTLETLDILIANGWDINSHGTHGSYSEPLLWCAIRDKELFERCLYHGARVDLNDRENGGPRPILEIAAVHRDIELFELLRSRGAPLSPQVLPLAVRAANDYAAKGGESPSSASRGRASYEKALEMVRHLIEVVGLDVNGLSRWGGLTCINPLCSIACYPRGDATELICMLLAKGGDPHLAGPQSDNFKINSAYEAATELGNISFLRALETWKGK